MTTTPPEPFQQHDGAPEPVELRDWRDRQQPEATDGDRQPPHADVADQPTPPLYAPQLERGKPADSPTPQPATSQPMTQPPPPPGSVPLAPPPQASQAVRIPPSLPPMAPPPAPPAPRAPHVPPAAEQPLTEVTRSEPVKPRASGGVSMYGLTFGLAALVAVGGVSFGVGRWTAEDPSSPLARIPNAPAGAAAGTGPRGAGFTAEEGQGQRRQRGPDGQQFAGGQGQRGSEAQPLAAGQLAPADAVTREGAPEPPALGNSVDQRPDVQAPNVGRTQTQGGGGGADDTAGGRQFRGGGPGGPAGFGRDGVQGTVTAVLEGGLALDTGQGEIVQYGTGPDTSYVRESQIEGTSAVLGEAVRVQFPLPQFVDGQIAEPGPGADIATTVTVLRPGADLTQGAGRGQAGPRGDGQGGQGAGRGQGPGGPVGRGGFGRGGVQGTILAVAEGGLMLTLASGETQLVSTDAATRFVRELDADPTELTVGDQVRIQLPRGGFGQGGAAADPAVDQNFATTVTIIEGSAAPAADASTTTSSQLLSANDATFEELVAGLESVAVASANRWAFEIIENRPYPQDDPTLSKLQDALAASDPPAETLAAILSILEP